MHRCRGASLPLPAPTLQLSFLSGKISGRLCSLRFPSHGSLRAQVSLILLSLGTAHPRVLRYHSSPCPWVPLIATPLGTTHPCVLGCCSSLHPWVPLIPTSSGSFPHPRILLIPASLSSSHMLGYCSSLHPWVPLIPTSSSTDYPWSGIPCPRSGEDTFRLSGEFWGTFSVKLGRQGRRVGDPAGRGQGWGLGLPGAHATPAQRPSLARCPVPHRRCPISP